MTDNAICIWRHADGSVCGHVRDSLPHGPLDYSDHPDGSLRRALAQWAKEAPTLRGVRHPFCPGYVLPAEDPLTVLAVPGQEVLPWSD